MKLAIISNHPGSAIDRVMQPLARELRRRGHEVAVFQPGEGLGSGGHDLIHCGWFALDQATGGKAECPMTANVWSVPIGKIPAYATTLRDASFARLIVDDLTTLQILGQAGFTRVSLIPLAFDTDEFKPLPPPEGEFTVGVFGNGYESKRFSVAQAACKAGGFRFFPQIMDPGRRFYMLDPVRDVYPHIHTLVHASFVDTNSMPVIEALLCSRPVVCTRNYGLERVLVDEFNGAFFDGSVEDLVEKLKYVEKDYAHLSIGGGWEWLSLPSVEETSMDYEKMFEKVLEEEA